MGSGGQLWDLAGPWVGGGERMMEANSQSHDREAVQRERRAKPLCSAALAQPCLSFLALFYLFLCPRLLLSILLSSPVLFSPFIHPSILPSSLISSPLLFCSVLYTHLSSPLHLTPPPLMTSLVSISSSSSSSFFFYFHSSFFLSPPLHSISAAPHFSSLHSSSLLSYPFADQ